MQRLVQFVFLVVWVVGVVAGGLAVQPPASDRPEEPLYVLTETSHAHLGVACEHIVLAVDAPRQSEWRFSAPIPEPFAPCRSEETSSAPGPDADAAVHPSVVSFFIRPLIPLP